MRERKKERKRERERGKGRGRERKREKEREKGVFQSLISFQNREKIEGEREKERV